jgi:MSHA biogenesis protein MshJ
VSPALRLRGRTLARRIDALSLRERVILFVSAVALLAGVADALVLSPQFALQKSLAQRMHHQNRELGALRQRVAQAAAPLGTDDSPRGRALAALQRVHEEQAALARQLDTLLPPADAARVATQPDLPQLLERVLRRHERLTLLQLATVDDGARSGGDAAASGTAPALPASRTALPARALELKLQGAYADLLQYLLDIERAVPGQRWSTWQLATGQGAPVLTLRLKLAGELR